jgi:hypothetical protein
VFAARRPQPLTDLSEFDVDGDPLASDGLRGDLTQVFASDFEAVHRVGFRLGSVNVGESAVLAGDDLDDAEVSVLDGLFYGPRLRPAANLPDPD